MLSNTDLQGVRDSVKQWSQRKNIADDILNDFIEIALSKANRSLRIPSLEGFSSLDVDENGFAKLPSNFIEVKELQYLLDGKEIILDRKHISEVDYMSNHNQSGMEPRIFGRYLNQIRIAPWDGSTGESINLYYFLALPPLVDDTDTNWFTLYAPEVLLYGALSELSSYTRDPEGVNQWESKFNTKIQELQAVEDRAAFSGSTLGVTAGGSTGKNYSRPYYGRRW